VSVGAEAGRAIDAPGDAQRPQRAQRGAVRVNGQDLYANFRPEAGQTRRRAAAGLLHNSLPVGSALRYTAELRLPPDTGRDEIHTSVGDILEVVGLTKRRGTLIRDLSGGQVKRAEFGQRLMARPSLLFLDEVTSGLDEQTDRDDMELFRQVADNGKTVVCITHSLPTWSDLSLVVILTEGGKLAFVGTPEEARTYFGIARLGDVYRKLAQRPAAQWQADFRANPLHERYVADRLPSGIDDETAEPPLVPVAETRPSVNPLWQAAILARRYGRHLARDPMAMLTLLGQAFLVALLLGVVFGKLADVEIPFERAVRTQNLLFLLNVSCFWFGCNNAAKELVKERVIYERERDFTCASAVTWRRNSWCWCRWCWPRSRSCTASSTSGASRRATRRGRCSRWRRWRRPARRSGYSFRRAPPATKSRRRWCRWS